MKNTQIPYKKLKTLVAGSGTSVVIATVVDSKLPVVVKKVSIATTSKRGQFLRENQVLAKLQDRQNVVQLVGGWLEPSTDGKDLLYVTMTRHVPGGDWFDYIHRDVKTRRLRGRIVVRMLLPIARVLSYLHLQIGFAHCDVSLENMLRNQNSAIMCDFGLSMNRQCTKNLFPRQGRDLYMAPEIHQPYLQPKGYDVAKSDVYSLGICILMLMFWTPIFSFAQKEFMGSQLWDLTRCMLEQHPLKRCSMTSVVHGLQNIVNSQK